MKRRTEISKQKRFVEEMRAKQSNTVWPDPLINSRGVDEFLWKGSADAPLIQRMAAWMFGLFFILGGVAFLDVAHKKQSWLFGLLSIGWFLVGGKVFLNGFKRRKAKSSGQ